MNGAASGPEAVRAIELGVKSLYDYQELSFYGDDDNGFIEEYTTQIRG
jgi:hypothetical protein